MNTKTIPKTVVIALTGGPGSGKTNAASALFQYLSARGLKVEQIREHVKDLAWRGTIPTYFDEEWFFGEQSHRQSQLYGRVDVLITDKPLWMHVLYANRVCKRLGSAIAELVRGHHAKMEAEGYRAVHVFVRRIHPYRQEGRYQTETDARLMDDEIATILTTEGVPAILSDSINILKIVPHLGLGVQ